KDPLSQGVLVLEVVVEGLAADPAGVADVADPHLVEGLLLQQLLEGVGQGPLGQIGFRHTKPLPSTFFDIVYQKRRDGASAGRECSQTEREVRYAQTMVPADLAPACVRHPAAGAADLSA